MPAKKTDYKAKFKGCYVATLTPFSERGAFDPGAIAAHTQWLIENGVSGLCPAGTTGEFLFLSHEEKTQVVSMTISAMLSVAVTAGRGLIPILAGVWSLHAIDAAELAHRAEGMGADGVFLPPPIYYPANDDTIFAFYETVKNRTKLPVFAYNIPQCAANEISLDCLERLFSAGIIAGIKDSSGKRERIKQLVKRFGAQYTVFAASDAFAAEGRALKADGFISALGNVVPGLFADLWDGKTELQADVDTLRNATKQIGSIPALKYLLKRQGFDFGKCRLPAVPLTDTQRGLLDSLPLNYSRSAEQKSETS